MIETPGLAYFPSVQWFVKAISLGTIGVDPQALHSKTSHWNRILLAGAEGPVRLSIPLQKGRANRLRFSEIKIANEYNWQDQHWKSINTCYNKSPWFEFYKDSLKELYGTNQEHLFDWNRSCLQWVSKRIGWSGELKLLDQQEQLGSSVTKLQSNESGLINIPVIKYRQVFEERTGFLDNLSIFSVDFNCSLIMVTYLPSSPSSSILTSSFACWILPPV